MAFHIGNLLKGKARGDRPVSDDLDRRLAAAMPPAPESDCVMLRAEDCAEWQSNPVRQVLAPQACQALIDDIAARRGNLVPVRVRRSAPGAQHPYEVLIGRRRRFAVEWLNRNGRPEIQLKAQIVEMTDEEVFRHLDTEHRDREDSAGGELERARGYEVAVDRFYNGVQSRMAEALGFSNSQISRLLSLAQLPQDVVRAFPTPDELRVRHAEVLTPLLRRPAQRARILQAAALLAHEQQVMAQRHEPLLPAATVLARLKQAALAPDDEAGALQMVHVDGMCVGSAKCDRQGMVTFELTVPDQVPVEALLERLREVLEDHRLGATRA
jgi:ParB family transcriptional regulator, chromosome partitioning protein